MPAKQNLFIKNCVFILTHLISVAFQVFSIWCNTPVETFFHCSKQCLNSSISMPFSASAVFCFTSSTSAKCFPLRKFFIRGKQKKVSQGEIKWTGRMGHGDHAIFGQKLLNTQCGVGRYTCKSPIMQWAMHWNSLQKKFTEAKRSLSQQHQLVHWYRWVPRTLT